MNAREMERRLLMAHEERMRQSVRDLFGPPELALVNDRCVCCGTVFARRSRHTGARRFCSMACKNKHRNVKRRSA